MSQVAALPVAVENIKWNLVYYTPQVAGLSVAIENIKWNLVY